MRLLIETICLLFCHLNLKNLTKIVSRNIFSKSYYFILKKNIQSNNFRIKRKLPINFYKVGALEINELRQNMKELDQQARKEIIVRINFFKKGLKNCYIGKNEKGENVYLQCIIFPFENEAIKKYFKKKFYLLNKNEIILENAFTFPKFRKLGLLHYGTNFLLNMAKESGYKTAVCYIRHDNIQSLNEFMKMGFKITKMVREYKLAGFCWRTL